jgi:hypothetical protein
MLGFGQQKLTMGLEKWLCPIFIGFGDTKTTAMVLDFVLIFG